MGVQNEIDRITDEVATQTGLIGQIEAALEAAAGGEGGVDLSPIVEALINKGQTVPDNASVSVLAGLIAAIESGGGGGTGLPIKIAVKTAVFSTSSASNCVEFKISDYGMTLPNFAACIANVDFNGDDLESSSVNATYAYIQYKRFVAALYRAKGTENMNVKTFTDGTAFSNSFTASPGHNIAYKNSNNSNLYTVRANVNAHQPCALAGVEYIFVLAEVV